MRTKSEKMNVHAGRSRVSEEHPVEFGESPNDATYLGLLCGSLVTVKRGACCEMRLATISSEVPATARSIRTVRILSNGENPAGLVIERRNCLLIGPELL